MEVSLHLIAHTSSYPTWPHTHTNTHTETHIHTHTQSPGTTHSSVERALSEVWVNAISVPFACFSILSLSLGYNFETSPWRYIVGLHLTYLNCSIVGLATPPCFFFLNFLATARGMQDLSSLLGDSTHVSGSGSMESWPLDCHWSSRISPFYYPADSFIHPATIYWAPTKCQAHSSWSVGNAAESYKKQVQILVNLMFQWSQDNRQTNKQNK